MVVATAAGYRVLLRQAQAGNGLAGIEQFHAGTGNQVGKVAAAGGGGREQLDEIEHRALGGQQAPGRTVEATDCLIGEQGVAIIDQPFNDDARIDLAGNFIRPGTATEDGGFAGDDAAIGLTFRRNQTGGDVAVAHVLCQSAADVINDGALQAVECEIGHRDSGV